MAASHNIGQTLNAVVSLEGWHSPLSTKTSVPLHVHVSFGERDIGGEGGSQVSFTLSLRRAELWVLVSETEPIAIDPSSISRTINKQKMRVTRRSKEATRLGLVAGIRAKLTGLNFSASGRAEKRNEQAIGTSSQQESIGTRYYKAARGEFVWEITSTSSQSLLDAPWDGQAKPRLKLRKTSDDKIDPIVRLEVRCKRKDLNITNLEFKDEERQRKVQEREGYKRRLAAAEGLIKDLLIKEGLQTVGEQALAEPLTDLLLARMICEVEVRNK